MQQTPETNTIPELSKTRLVIRPDILFVGVAPGRETFSEWDDWSLPVGYSQLSEAIKGAVAHDGTIADGAYTEDAKTAFYHGKPGPFNPLAAHETPPAAHVPAPKKFRNLGGKALHHLFGKSPAKTDTAFETRTVPRAVIFSTQVLNHIEPGVERSHRTSKKVGWDQSNAYHELWKFCVQEGIPIGYLPAEADNLEMANPDYTHDLQAMIGFAFQNAKDPSFEPNPAV